MIYVFYSNDPLAQDQGGGAEHFRGLHRALKRSGLPFKLVGARLQPHADDPRVDYVSTGSNFLLFWLGLWRWFWENGHHIGRHDVLHFHRNYAAWPKIFLAPRRGRIVISYHNVTGKVIEGKLGRLSEPLRHVMLWFERHVASRADAIVCVSARDRQVLSRIVEHEPFARAHVIPAAFDGDLFAQRTTAPPPPDLACKLVVLGRISHQKNIPLAVSTLEQLVSRGVDATLTIAGDGEDARDLVRRIAQSFARDRIRWLGRVPHDQVPELLAAHGVLLVTSRYEASPTVVKEAIRASRPVVTTDVGDVALWIEPGCNGFICGTTPSSLADGAEAAIALVRDQRYRVGSKLDQLDETAIMQRMLGLYQRLAAG